VTEPLRIDLNADLGEITGHAGRAIDQAMMSVVTSANVACGFHAGDDKTMRSTCALAVAHGVVVGAHVSYDDREGFGRREVAITVPKLVDDVVAQLNMLTDIACAAGAPVRYVKAHGALYNRSAHDFDHASALVQAVAAHDPNLVLLVAPRSVASELAVAAGLRVAYEGFVDRSYRNDATLTPRSEPSAVHATSEECVAQAMSIVVTQSLTSSSGERVALDVDSLCVHGDTPHAVATAQQVRAALVAHGVALRPFV